MSIIQAIILGILQGATEFIPVSSSGHLVLVPWLLGWDAPGLAFAVVVHVGTALGVILYFWRDWLAMAASTWRSVVQRQAPDANLRLLGLILLGILPAAIIGGLFRDFFEAIFETPLISALMLLVTAALLVTGERLGKLRRTAADLTWADSVVIGLAQALAIIPGISRSGSTIAAGRLRDITREDAARFSFLLATPLIIAVGLVQILDLAQAGLDISGVGVLLAGFVASFASAYLVIRWLLAFLRTRSTIVFAVYCVTASAFSLIVYFVRGG